MTTYHYNQNNGIITTKPNHNTKPITNILQNIILQELQQINLSGLKLTPYMTTTQELYIRITNNPLVLATIIIENNQIRFLDYHYKSTLIPYSQYTTLKELIHKHL